MMRIVLMFTLIILSEGCFASGGIVYDPTSDPKIIQEAVTLQDQLNNLEKQLDQLKQTYNETKSIEQDATGHYGWGNFMNGPSDWQSHEWTSSTWANALNGLAGGNQARYAELLQQYKIYHPTLSQSDYAKGSSQAQSQNYEQNVATNQAAMTQSSYEYNQLNQITQQLSQLSSQIENPTNTDTKSAIDLNSRLIEAVANIQLEELKMQTVMNEQIAQAGASNISYSTQQAQFNTVPNP